MALLESLYPDFTQMSDEEQQMFIRNYRNKRREDFAEVTQYSVNKKADALTEDEKALLKLLKISAKDLRALKSLNGGDQDDDEEEESVDGIPQFDND